QLTALNNTQMTEDSYMKIIEAKTAALFAAATEIGGVIAQADTANIKALYAYGRNLGIAFQLVDDVLDYGGIGHKLGKNTGEDFTEGKVTLPVILAVHRGNKTQRDFWREAMSRPQNGENNEAQFEQALQLLKQNNALKDTIIRAVHYGDRAKDAIGLFENSQTRTQLIELADFCTNRAY
ncbi:MAG: polyprenyl synthetase family protein, partial [Parvibaculales bacterium]